MLFMPPYISSDYSLAGKRGLAPIKIVFQADANRRPSVPALLFRSDFRLRTLPGERGTGTLALNHWRQIGWRSRASPLCLPLPPGSVHNKG